MGKHYLYRHIRKDTESVFYVGIGTKSEKYETHIKEYSRAFVKSKRNVIWNRIIAKTDYEVEILMESDDYDFIKQKEIEFIALYGRRDLDKGTLCNLTDGGEGSKNIIVSKETSAKLSKSLKGHITTNETKLAISISNTGKKRTKEMCEAQRLARLGDKSHTAKLTLNSQTGIYYGTIDEAAYIHGIGRTAMSDMLNGKRRNTTNVIFAESENGGVYLRVPKTIPKYIPIRTEESIKKQSNTMKNRDNYNSVLLLDTATGIFYMSIREAAEALGHNWSTLTQRLNGGLVNNTSLIRV